MGDGQYAIGNMQLANGNRQMGKIVKVDGQLKKFECTGKSVLARSDVLKLQSYR